jgi:hypothetical protein
MIVSQHFNSIGIGGIVGNSQQFNCKHRVLVATGYNERKEQELLLLSDNSYTTYRRS